MTKSKVIDIQNEFEKDLIKILEKYGYIDNSKFMVEGVKIETSIDSQLKIDLVGLIYRK